MSAASFVSSSPRPCVGRLAGDLAWIQSSFRQSPPHPSSRGACLADTPARAYASRPVRWGTAHGYMEACPLMRTRGRPVRWGTAHGYMEACPLMRTRASQHPPLGGCHPPSPPAWVVMLAKPRDRPRIRLRPHVSTSTPQTPRARTSGSPIAPGGILVSPAIPSPPHPPTRRPPSKWPCQSVGGRGSIPAFSRVDTRWQGFRGETRSLGPGYGCRLGLTSCR